MKTGNDFKRESEEKSKAQEQKEKEELELYHKNMLIEERYAKWLDKWSDIRDKTHLKSEVPDSAFDTLYKDNHEEGYYPFILLFLYYYFILLLYYIIYYYFLKFIIFLF